MRWFGAANNWLPPRMKEAPRRRDQGEPMRNIGKTSRTARFHGSRREVTRLRWS
jgi:hypothetical protein